MKMLLFSPDNEDDMMTMMVMNDINNTEAVPWFQWDLEQWH